MEAAAVDTPLQALGDALAQRLGPRVGVSVVGLQGQPEALFPAEAASVASAVPRRQREYAWGRTAARAAMRQLGWPVQPVPSGPDRAPLWPAGLVGSISHCRTACVALVARHSHGMAVGVDVEEAEAVDPDLWELLFTPRERAALRGLPTEAQNRQATRLFSAKEAFYKWQYPHTATVLEFQDVELEWEDEGAGFSVACTRLAGTPAGRAQGHWLGDGQRVVSWVISRSGHGG